MFGLAGCGGERSTRPAEQLTPDAQLLVAQLSDLPTGFNLVPAESFPIPLSKVLSDPWAASSAAIIRRERVSGYQVSFTSPHAVRRLECSAAVYRSATGARKVYRLRTRSVAAFVADIDGHSLRGPRIGEESIVSRFGIHNSQHLAVAWRFKNVLATCVSGGFSTPPPEAEIMTVARAQQARIAAAVGGRIGR